LLKAGFEWGAFFWCRLGDRRLACAIFGIGYQDLGMTKIAGASNQLPKTFFRYNILNPTTNTIASSNQDFVMNLSVIYSKSG
jgi:hypothetical protein